MLVIGAGIMGAGIAQVAAQAGHRVLLFDAREGAAAEAMAKLARTLDALVAKGKLTEDAADATLARIEPITALEEAGEVRLVIEAIVENLDAKRALFQQLEAAGRAPTACWRPTPRRSRSRRIANGLAASGPLVGMHFFNPVPLMKLVEVVSGLHTDAPVAAGRSSS